MHFRDSNVRVLQLSRNSRRAMTLGLAWHQTEPDNLRLQTVLSKTDHTAAYAEQSSNPIRPSVATKADDIAVLDSSQHAACGFS